MQPVTITIQMQGRVVGQIQLEDHLNIGRIPENNLVLAKPSISRYHAEIHLTDQGVMITDVGSSYATFVTDRKLEPKKPYSWLAGETVDLLHKSFGVNCQRKPTQFTVSVLHNKSQTVAKT